MAQIAPDDMLQEVALDLGDSGIHWVPGLGFRPRDRTEDYAPGIQFCGQEVGALKCTSKTGCSYGKWSMGEKWTPPLDLFPPLTPIYPVYPPTYSGYGPAPYYGGGFGYPPYYGGGGYCCDDDDHEHTPPPPPPPPPYTPPHETPCCTEVPPYTPPPEIPPAVPLSGTAWFLILAVVALALMKIRNPA